MHHHVLLMLVSIGLLSLGSQWLAWRLRVPAILFLLLSGLLLGPALGLLKPDALFGDLLFPFVSLAVAVILFEGSLTLNREEIRGHGKVVRRLITWGVLIIWLAVACLSHWFAGMDWPLAFLFGAIMTVTGPTVIMPMLQAVRPTAAVANILRWEGILVDPIGAMLAVLTFTVGNRQPGLNHWNRGSPAPVKNAGVGAHSRRGGRNTLGSGTPAPLDTEVSSTRRPCWWYLPCTRWPISSRRSRACWR